MTAALTHGIGIALFVGAAVASIGVIATSIAPQWRRIARLALGHVEPAVTPMVRGS